MRALNNGVPMWHPQDQVQMTCRNLTAERVNCLVQSEALGSFGTATEHFEESVELKKLSSRKGSELVLGV